MAKQGKGRSPKRPGKMAAAKSKRKPDIAEKRRVVSFKNGQKAARRGGTTATILEGPSLKYKVYGATNGRITRIGGKSTASSITGRLGITPGVFREVDQLIDSLRSRKKIG